MEKYYWCNENYEPDKTKIYKGKTPEAAAKKIWRENKSLNLIIIVNTNNQDDFITLNSSQWIQKGGKNKFKT